MAEPTGGRSVDWVARGLGALTLLAVLGNSVMVWRLDRHDGPAAAQGARGGANAAGAAAPRRGRAAIASSPAPEHGPEGALEALDGAGAGPAAGLGGGAHPPPQRRERIRELASDWRDAAIAEVEAFGEDAHLDDSKVDAILEELMATADAMNQVREDMRAGGITLAEAKVEMREIKDASDGRMDQLLGADKATELRERLRDSRPF